MGQRGPPRGLAYPERPSAVVMVREEGGTSSPGLIGGSASDPQLAALSGSNYKAPGFGGE
jgi:hypothetical protein